MKGKEHPAVLYLDGDYSNQKTALSYTVMKKDTCNTQSLLHLPSRMDPHLLAYGKRTENRLVGNMLLK